MVAGAAEFGLPADEPSADGHFPGHPIIPGAVLLREIIRIVSADTGSACCGIRSARFLHPVRPGDRLAITWQERAPGEIGFTGSIGSPSRAVITGSLTMRAR